MGGIFGGVVFDGGIEGFIGGIFVGFDGGFELYIFLFFGKGGLLIGICWLLNDVGGKELGIDLIGVWVVNEVGGIFV